MTQEIMWEFAESFCVLFSVAFVFSKLRIVRDHLTAKPTRLQEKLVLALLFGALGCVGSWIGIEFKDSLINTRVIGVAVGGLLGGPLTGVLAGTIAGVHRIFFVDAGQATATVCGLSMIAEGAFAGFFSRYSYKFEKLWTLATLTVVLCELFRKLMLLLFIEPSSFAVVLVEHMTPLMLVINSLGVALFVTFIENVAREQDLVKARQAELVLSNLLKETEIKVLQTQINPHFLFNTLTMIGSLCRIDPQKARDVIDHLADFYRKNLRVNERFATLQDEIEHIEAYLEIVKARYPSKIGIRYDVDRNLECYLPPLSLQPLVENSVKHGLLPKREGGVISIRAKREAEKKAVRIEVEDDGRGFDPNGAWRESGSHIGLDNVHERLQRCFGDDLTWTVDTDIDKGTRVTIVIPVFSNA